ncbi:MAG: hypothetical protein ABII13_02765 [Patescibacteria group bacterium]|nr:hypothetical protein [Patescibacteria group bacterium]MBU2509584.1 hypothetical protein [Patescibacteria group bacterium]
MLRTQISEGQAKALSGEARISVTCFSHTMRSLFDSCVKHYLKRRGIALIVDPEDSLELMSFVTRLTDILLTAEPSLIQPGELNLFKETSFENMRLSDIGVFIWQSSLMTEGMLQQLLSLLRDLKRPKLVIARFCSEQAYKDATSRWPQILKDRFPKEPFVWPSLAKRQMDLEGIVGEICDSLVQHSDGAPRRPEISEAALCEIRLSRSVASLYTKIQTALRMTDPSMPMLIEPRHLRASQPPPRPIPVHVQQ